MTRRKAYKKHPKLAKETDFLTQHEKKLHELHKKYMADTGEKIEFISFADYVYNNAQDLVLNPENN